MTVSQGADPLVIAHRGASGYLPEHTLASKAMAHAMGADYLEQDVVLTADGIPVVLHDIYLAPTTDVEQRYPERARDDGHYYAIDFTLEEIHRLRVHERSKPVPGGGEKAVYPARYPLQAGPFTVPTLAEEIELVSGLNRSRGMRTGLYIELKAPAWHRAQGQDIAAAVLQVLADKGYANNTEQVFLQCFDPDTLRYLRHQLKTPLPLIQLLGDNSWKESSADYQHLLSDSGLQEIASYADGIGPWLMQIYSGSKDGVLQTTDLVKRAHRRGLLVHPYTFRADELPAGIDSFAQLLDLFVDTLQVDGLFSDFPDRVRNYLTER